MSKELTPLEALQNLTEYLTGSYRDCFEELSIIKTALKRLETLEEEKQSFDRQLEKKLKALEIIKKYYKDNDNSHVEFKAQPIDKLDEFYENMQFVKEVLL